MKPCNDGAGRHCLLSKEVARAHWHADAYAELCQGRRHHGNHRRRKRIVDPPRKDDMIPISFASPLGGEKPAEHRDQVLPQYEAGAGANMSTTLPPLKDEIGRSVLQEHLQELGGWDMQVGDNSIFFQQPGLIWSSSGN